MTDYEQLDQEADNLRDQAIRLSYRRPESHQEELAQAAKISAFVELATMLRRDAASMRGKQALSN